LSGSITFTSRAGNITSIQWNASNLRGAGVNMDPIRIGPSNSDGGVSSQVGGFMWYITLASNI